MSDEDSAFDEIMAIVGDDGRFQSRFNVLFNFVLLMLVSMANLNLFVAMSVPEHWCHVPGRESSPYSAEEWKALTIPRENGTYSECRMYNVSGSPIGNFSLDEVGRVGVVDCQHGWEYNKTWYRVTAPSQENWVCGDKMHVVNAFVFARLGDLIGNFIFGQVADIFGRVIVYYLTLITIISGRILLVLSSNHVTLFMFATFFSSLAVSAIFQSPLVIAMEMTKPEKRAHIAMLQCVGWTIAFCAIPMIMWVLKDWVSFIWVTTIPSAIFLFAQRFIVESPRWLASRGKSAECIKQLEKIAKVNGTKITDEVRSLLVKATTKRETIYGIASLFSNWRLAKNVCLIVYGMVLSNLIYYVLTLNVNNMGGNPHMNFFWQGFAELPAYVLGKYVCDSIGRRWTNVAGCVGMTLASAPLIFTVRDNRYELLTLSLSIFLKFCVCLCFYAANLQALEVYPTCVRQSGVAFGGITSNAVGTIGPYIVHMGTSGHPGYPYAIACVLGVSGAVTALFIPETLNQKLPESLAEAHVFGKDQKIWSFPRSAYREAKTYDVAEKYIL